MSERQLRRAVWFSVFLLASACLLLAIGIFVLKASQPTLVIEDTANGTSNALVEQPTSTSPIV